jgi:transposase
MAIADRMRDWMDRRDGLVPADGRSPTTEPEPDAELARRRDRLSEDVAQAQFDLGGLTYEMAIRDHFRLDVLLRRAAHLQELDAELAEVERLIRLRDGGASGSCGSCGALHSRGAVFCWQCGGRLLETA